MKKVGLDICSSGSIPPGLLFAYHMPSPLMLFAYHMPSPLVSLGAGPSFLFIVVGLLVVQHTLLAALGPAHILLNCSSLKSLLPLLSELSNFCPDNC